MIEWMQKALEKLTSEEFAIVMAKVQKQYKQGGKIVSVIRSEKQTQVTVQLTSGEQKLVVL